MNNYITLASNTVTVKKFMTPFKMWEPLVEKPMTIRYTWSGTMDVSYAAGAFKTWSGMIRALVNPSTGWGSVSDARNLIMNLESVTFVDHYGVSRTAHIMPDGPEKSIGPKWDGAANVILFPIKIIAE